jgi:acyl dehydratase
MRDSRLSGAAPRKFNATSSPATSGFDDAATHRSEGIQVMRGLYWEEWEIGAEFESPARTITEADIVFFAGLSGDYNPLHINEEYCKTTQFGSRIAHGPLVYAIAAGLLYQLHLYDDTLIAFLGFDSLKFTKPVKPSDTIHARIKVLEKRETSNADRGVMKRQLQILNQRGEVVQEGVQAFLLKRKPTGKHQG